MVMVIYHYVYRIGELLLLHMSSYNIYDLKKYYPRGPINIHIRLFINNIQEKNWVITNKKRVRENYHYFVVMENG